MGLFNYPAATSFTPLIRVCVLIMATALCQQLFAQTQAFETKLPGEMKWSQITPTGTLMVGGAKYLANYHPDKGEQLWVRNDLKNLASFNVRPVPGLPYLVISELVSKFPMKSRLLVLDLLTGETLWETGATMGNNLGGYAVPSKGMVIFIRNISGERGTKAGAYISALELDTGEELWRTRIGSMGSLPTNAIDNNGFISGQDLSGHPAPIVVDNSFLLVAGDIYAFDLSDGFLRWRYKLKASHPNLKQTFAQPIVEDDILYAAGAKQVVALNIETGTEIWKTKVSKAAIPQLAMVQNSLIGRFGGTFSDGKKLHQLKPFGVFVINKSDGVKKWEWKKAKHSITNFALYPQADLVALADKTTLYALQLSATKPTVVEKEKLAFKRKMGKAEVAAKALGAVGGFLTGGLAGSARSLGGGDRSDPPLDISLFENQLVVRGQYHVLAYDLVNRTTVWSVEFAPPGVNGLALMAMGAVTLTASMGYAAQARNPYSLGSAQSFVTQTANLNNSFQTMVSERYAASEKGTNVAFFLTKEDKSRSLVGLNLRSGEKVGTIAMAEKEPQFQVDSVTGRVYHFAKGAHLVAYDFAARESM